MKTQFHTTKQSLLKTVQFFGLCMILSLFTIPTIAQERTVSGQVTGVDGPLEAASVVLKGSSEYVQTDEEGKFVFPRQLAANDVLVVSSLGFETTEVVIGADTNFVSPFLKDVSVVIIAALRTKPAGVDDPN